MLRCLIESGRVPAQQFARRDDDFKRFHRRMPEGNGSGTGSPGG